MCDLQEQWGHVEEIELMNDGSGLGFGIVGGKAAGVVVRTLVQNSVADKVCLCSTSSPNSFKPTCTAFLMQKCKV